MLVKEYLTSFDSSYANKRLILQAQDGSVLSDTVILCAQCEENSVLHSTLHKELTECIVLSRKECENAIILTIADLAETPQPPVMYLFS